MAAVAAWNEFGTKDAAGATRIPERPFFRQAISQVDDGVLNLLRHGTDPKKGVVDLQLANRVGAYVQGEIQKRIIELVEPPNAPSTVKAKRSSNPLIDIGVMRGSVTYRVK